MKLLFAVVASVICLYPHKARAFRSPFRPVSARIGQQRVESLRMSEESDAASSGTVASRIANMKSMAARLKAEAAQLEAVQQQDRMDSLKELFGKFDTNNDGAISVEELQEGFDKILQQSITEEQSVALMKVFDDSGDGKLQLDEFRDPEILKAKLEKLIREQEATSRATEIEAQVAAQEAKEAEERAVLFAELLNDAPPTLSDRFLSVLPYFLPLLDSAAYGLPIIQKNINNPIVEALVALNSAYSSIPFSGLVAFIILNVLSNNLSLNRIIRFNIQQAINIDIALIVPSLLGGIGAFVPGVTEEMGMFASSAIFVAFTALITYCAISSLFGVVPDNIPLVSTSAKLRAPTLDMFDQKTGLMLPKEQIEENDREKRGGSGSGKGKEGKGDSGSDPGPSEEDTGSPDTDV